LPRSVGLGFDGLQYLLYGGIVVRTVVGLRPPQLLGCAFGVFAMLVIEFVFAWLFLLRVQIPVGPSQFSDLLEVPWCACVLHLAVLIE